MVGAEGGGLIGEGSSDNLSLSKTKKAYKNITPATLKTTL